jgi:hypothetical protein
MKKTGHLLLYGGVIILVLILVLVNSMKEGFDNVNCSPNGECSVLNDTCTNTSYQGAISNYTCTKNKAVSGKYKWSKNK